MKGSLLWRRIAEAVFCEPTAANITKSPNRCKDFDLRLKRPKSKVKFCRSRLIPYYRFYFTWEKPDVHTFFTLTFRRIFGRFILENSNSISCLSPQGGNAGVSRMANRDSVTATFKQGLEDVLAGTSAICFIDGIQGRLVYRGYDIRDLAEYSTFEETAYLLWHGKLPTSAQLRDFSAQLSENRGLPDYTYAILRSSPKSAHPMGVLRSAVSFLGLADDEAEDNSLEANRRKAIRLLSKVPTIIATYHRLRKGLSPVAPSSSLGHAANFLYMLNGTKPEKRVERIFDICLILHADHEFNASTFAGRVTAATLSDFYSAVTSAIGTLKGPLHGGANEYVMKMLIEIGEPSKVESYVRAGLAAKRKIPGFGHRVYKTEDPRATVLRKISKEVGERAGNTRWYEMSLGIEKIMKEEKNLYPNVDFYSASTYYELGIPIDLFTPTFAVSRISGWAAHILEQYANNRLIRPLSEYVGPLDLPYIPIDQRQ
jgi:citrate synthase